MWYKLTNGSEYSTDFNFFIQNQLMVVKSGNRYKFQSRIENRVFKTERVIFGNTYELSDSAIDRISKDIHKELLEGKHGTGTLVD